ncbi:6-bladed beta-propeller [Sphingobacterium sp. MYb388]|uniref:6-bladed beta-propeller n=1 Tax=Sphingobacterium sp. MYb388 TaxID=2745437 RepID=UPI0030B6E01B
MYIFSYLFIRHFCSLSIVFLSFFCLSCDNGHSEKISFDRSDAAKSIAIDPIKVYATSKINNGSEIDFMKLNCDTSLMFSSISKFQPIDKSRFLIVDKTNNKIYVSDDSGKLYTKIGERGSALGQYTTVTDVEYDMNTDLIYVFSLPERKMLTYTTEGKFVDEKFSAFDFLTFTKRSNGYLVYGAFESNIENPYLNRNKKNNSNLIFISDDLSRILAGYINSGNFYDRMNNNDNFLQVKTDLSYFHYGYNDTIYCIDKSRIYPVYNIDFGKYQFPYEKASVFNNRKAYDLLYFKDEDPYYGITAKLSIGNEIVYMEYGPLKPSRNLGSNSVLYFRKNGNLKHIPSQLEQIPLHINRVLTIYDDKVYFEIIPRLLSKVNIDSLNAEFNLNISQESHPLILSVNEKDLM